MTTALGAGSLSYNGPRQIYTPNPIILATNSGTGEQSMTTRVRVPCPDSRCRVKISVMFVPAAGTPNPDITSTPGTIWVAAYEQDHTGGGAGRTVPVTDVEGTQAAPTSFPASAGLLGYSREFVTAADWLEVEVFLQSVGGDVAGTWMLQTRIQPDAVTFGWEEWDEIRRAFQPQHAGVQGQL